MNQKEAFDVIKELIWRGSRKDPIPKPVYRRLRGYAFDPSLSTRLETAPVNDIIFKVAWERLQRGPVGEYLEVVDYDPASKSFYNPVDLNNNWNLAQDGLAPSESNPQFHQQMVYAVAMTTIRNFENALGRFALWAPRDNRGSKYVRRLRIYPHAMRQANAYYSPAKKALLFGYFPASSDNPGEHYPGETVFTCLSHDIIAHETTHALLDGMHQLYIEPSNPDALAFHEAFADIVALFQHFTFPEVLRHQIAKTRGDLSKQNLLGEMAQQFGRAIGLYGSLRDAIGQVNPDTGQWESLVPNPDDYQTVIEPHDRGAILVATLFDAFITIYKTRVADLLRIATSGTGILPEGDLHPDLVKRLSLEAAKSARHMLNLCIRALDYCPPVDITFGDYLRAVITADSDIVPDDDRGYRLAILDSFRRRGIYPQDIRTFSMDSLRWPQAKEEGLNGVINRISGKSLKYLYEKSAYFKTREDAFNHAAGFRENIRDFLESVISSNKQSRTSFENLTGLVLSRNRRLVGFRKDKKGNPIFSVNSVWPVQRVGPDGNVLNEMVISITQERFIDDNQIFRGGCTLILDLETQGLRYCIKKPLFDDQRLERQKNYTREILGRSLYSTYLGLYERTYQKEPFALLHGRYT